ncbi:alkaline phosphatase [Muribaculum intestinale]|uniref:alkaline phosphatase n=1 Tax=Muribaculum intestinale TaxID=1796646 RepID=UPI003EBF62FB
MPALASLMEQGSYTLKKRTVLTSSSAPNWASMFMGAPTEIHGYTTWGSKTPEIPSPAVNGHGIFPTVFSIVRDAHPNADIAVLYEWEGIKYLVDILALSHQEQAFPTAEQPDVLCSIAEDYIKSNRPELIAVCFDEPDHTGHTAGHDTPEYYTMMKRLDGYLESEAAVSFLYKFLVGPVHGGVDRQSAQYGMVGDKMYSSHPIGAYCEVALIPYAGGWIEKRHPRLGRLQQKQCRAVGQRNITLIQFGRIDVP